MVGGFKCFGILVGVVYLKRGFKQSLERVEGGFVILGDWKEVNV
jgi:hypothetical protein